jgi:predicted esterase YcpF (UPF0227 family)
MKEEILKTNCERQLPANSIKNGIEKIYSVGNNGTIYYEKCDGDQHLPTIVFLPGTGNDHSSFNDFTSIIAHTYPYYSFDRPGTGNSSGIGEVQGKNITEFKPITDSKGEASEYVTILKDQGLKQVILCGASLGGHIAIELAKQLRMHGISSEVVTINSTPKTNIIDGLDSVTAKLRKEKLGSSMAESFFLRSKIVVQSPDLTDFYGKPSKDIKKLRRLQTDRLQKNVEDAKLLDGQFSTISPELDEISITEIKGTLDAILPGNRKFSHLKSREFEGTHAFYQTSNWMLPLLETILEKSTIISPDITKELTKKIEDFTILHENEISVKTKKNWKLLEAIANIRRFIDPLLVSPPKS